MAKIVDGFVFQKKEDGGKWAAYLDGKVWHLGPEDMGGKDVATISRDLRSAAQYRGMKLRTSRDGAGGFFAQAYDRKNQ